MGCCGSRHAPHAGRRKPDRGRQGIVRPVWASTPPMTRQELEVVNERIVWTQQAKRLEFWETQPHYGGYAEIWDALRAACETDDATANAILESAGVIVQSSDMSLVWDERGSKYELPKFVLADPTNLIKEAGNDVAGQGSEEALATPRSLGGGDSEPDEGTCAICLDRTPVEEVALVKGCEHSYCAKCILKWAAQRDNCWCPQCKAPFQYLFTYRNLDGTLNDFPQEESVVLLKRAEWFVATLKDGEKGKEVDITEPTHDYDRYYAEYDDDEEVEDYYFSAAAGRARIVVGNRRWGESGYVASGRMQARPVGPPGKKKGGKDKKPVNSPSAAAAGSSNAARRGKKGKGKAPNAAPTGAQASQLEGPAGGGQLSAASTAVGSSSSQPAAVAAHMAAKGKASADAVPGGKSTSAERTLPALAQGRPAKGKAPMSPGQSTSSSTAAPATPEQTPAKEASSSLASRAASGGLSAALAAASGNSPAPQAAQVTKTPGRVFGYKSNNVEHASNSPGAGSSSAAAALPAAEVGAATSLGGSAPVNISHPNAGPDPPQLYGSSWEHGSWGRNKAKRSQVDGSPLGSSPGSDGGKGVAGRRARRAAKRAAADARGAAYNF